MLEVSLHPKILAEQLHLSQPEGADYAHQIILAPPDLQTFLQPCDLHCYLFENNTQLFILKKCKSQTDTFLVFISFKFLVCMLKCTDYFLVMLLFFFAIIEIYPHCPDCPNGPKLQIHFVNVTGSLCWTTLYRLFPRLSIGEQTKFKNVINQKWSS